MGYNIFISHSWAYGDAYDKLIEMIDKQKLDYKNYSVPKYDPIHNASNTTELKNAIEVQIKPCSCVLVLAGVYATYSKWINVEIEIAKEHDKKIIAIEPWGSEKTSKFVKDNADLIVGWSGLSIVNAIKN
ncbi:MAG: TIR domain-containing protein [Campylobacteraceae bacterium]